LAAQQKAEKKEQAMDRRGEEIVREMEKIKGDLHLQQEENVQSPAHTSATTPLFYNFYPST